LLALTPEMKDLSWAAALAWTLFHKCKRAEDPDLPANPDACRQLMGSDCKRVRQIGAFALSWMRSQWDLPHPMLDDWLAAGCPKHNGEAFGPWED
jgi:hypothetical protein